MATRREFLKALLVGAVGAALPMPALPVSKASAASVGMSFRMVNQWRVSVNPALPMRFDVLYGSGVLQPAFPVRVLVAD